MAWSGPVLLETPIDVRRQPGATKSPARCAGLTLFSILHYSFFSSARTVPRFKKALYTLPMPHTRLVLIALFILLISVAVQVRAHQSAGTARIHATHFAARFGLVRMQWITRGAEISGELFTPTEASDPYPAGGSLLLVEPLDGPTWVCASVVAASTSSSTMTSSKTALALWPDTDTTIGTPGDNVWQGSALEPLYLATDDTAALRQPSAFALADGLEHEPLAVDSQLYVASRWCAGSLKISDTSMSCTPHTRATGEHATPTGALITLHGTFAQKGIDFRCPSSAPTVQ